MAVGQLKKKVPVTILTGFLGAGKTTLLNHILNSPDHKMKFAVIENEFGEIGVDDKIIKEKSEDAVIETMNGCICCTVRGDLVKVLEKLKSRVAEFDAIIIETTGLADPAPVAQTFCVTESLMETYTLDGIITVVDAMHWLQHVTEVKPEGVENESSEQVAFADRVLLNKIDLVDEAQLKDVEEKIKKINSQAQIFRTQQSKIDPMKLIGINAFSLERVLEMDPEFMNIDGEHQHDDSVSSISFKFEGDMNVNWLQENIGVMLQTHSKDLFRYKGILSCKGSQNKFVFQGVHMIFKCNMSDDFLWKDGEKRENILVFIGRNLDKPALENLFKDCLVSGPLRFKVGDEVEANVGSFEPGRVVQTWFEGNPYQIQLESGDLVFAPMDKDTVVRARKGTKRDFSLCSSTNSSK